MEKWTLKKHGSRLSIGQVGIKNFVFHGLRHHYCSFGGQLGASGQQLRSQMGHKTAALTDHYSHLDAEDTRFIGKALEQKLLKDRINANG